MRHLSRLALAVALLLTGWTAASAHGEKGLRDVYFFDLSAPAAAEHVARAASRGYQGALQMGLQLSEDECISFKLIPALHFSAEEPLFTISAASAGGMFGTDYSVWGEVTGGEGAYGLALRLGTVKSRTVVAEARGTFATAAHAASAAVVVASDLGRNLAGRVREFERKVRDKNEKTAMGPTLTVEPSQTEVIVGESVSVAVRLTDCDGTPLRGRKVEPRSNKGGSVSPDEIALDDEGAGEFRFTAPNKKATPSVWAVFIHQRPSERPIVTDGSEGIRVVYPPGHEPPVWRVEIEAHRVVDAGVDTKGSDVYFGSFLAGAFDPLRLEFDLDRNRKPLRDSLKAKYEWRWSQKVFILGVGLIPPEGRESGTELRDWDFELMRHLKPAEGVPELDVSDLDEIERTMAEAMASALPGRSGRIGQPPGTAIASYRAVIPGKIRDEEGEERETLSSLEDRPQVPYRYEQRVNEGTLKLPSTGAGGVHFSKNSLRYRFALQPTLRFEQCDVTVEIDGEEFTDLFRIVKYWREWRAPIRANVLGAPRSDEYVQGYGWQSGDDGIQNDFRDSPSVLEGYTQGPKEQWAAVRLLREYLVKVEDFPELGFWYYVYAFETTPPVGFEINRYESKRVTAEEWKKIKKADKPYRTEDTAGKPCKRFVNRE